MIAIIIPTIVKLNKTRYLINQLSCIMIILWMVLPYFRVHTGGLFLLAVMFVWILTTQLEWLTKKWTADLLFVIAFFITFIPYIITGNLGYGAQGAATILISFPIFFIGMFMNHYYLYYKKDYRMLGKIAFFALIAFTIGSLQTYIGLQTYPMASRLLATGSIAPELRSFYAVQGIGSFGFINSLIFISLALLYLALKEITQVKNYYRIVAMSSFVLIILTIITASFAITLTMTFIGIILVIFVRNKKSLVLVTTLSAIFILVFPNAFFGDVFFKISDIFSNYAILREKFIDVAESFMYAAEWQTFYRLRLYLSSLQTFLQHPCFGIYGPFGNPYSGVVGGHSGWLDLMAFYGLFASIPLFSAIYMNFRKLRVYFKTSNYFGFILVIQLLFITFGFVNPIVYVSEMGFVLFFIIPAIPFLPYAFKKRSEGLD